MYSWQDISVQLEHKSAFFIFLLDLQQNFVLALNGDTILMMKGVLNSSYICWQQNYTVNKLSQETESCVANHSNLAHARIVHKLISLLGLPNIYIHYLLNCFDDNLPTCTRCLVHEMCSNACMLSVLIQCSSGLALRLQCY